MDATAAAVRDPRPRPEVGFVMICIVRDFDILYISLKKFGSA
jgi:hypothetical protein